MSYIEINCQNNGAYKKYPYGISLSEILKDNHIALPHPVVGAYVNHRVCALQDRLNNNSIVRFFDFTDKNGRRFYFQSLTFILYKAVRDCYPNAELRINHSVPNGFFCTVKNLDEPIETAAQTIEKRMKSIIAADLPFHKTEILRDKVMSLFNSKVLTYKEQLISMQKQSYISVYQLDDEYNHFQNDLVPSTGYVHLFAIDAYNGGLLLRMPDTINPEKVADKIDSPKLFNIFAEHQRLGELLEAKNIPQLNYHVDANKDSMLIKVCEALQEKKIAQIAENIVQKKSRFVLIAGPSSSGKTTFSKRLTIQLATNGIRAFPLSMDDYFVDRELTPKDANGNYDFECIEAIDIHLFNEQLMAMNDGKTVAIPTFDFALGKKIYKGNTITLGENDVLVIEGIHGLNPRLLETVPLELTYRIFISALTQITIDRLDYISTTDNRLIRRLVRDFRYRKYSAVDTLNRWHSVRDGEDKNIFPFQENADSMFNSALIYELAVLKRYAEPLLSEVSEDEPEFGTAQRLLKILSLFHSITPDEVPPTSILREFLDGSSFKY